jgi:hypoxia-inducible factor prolyl hydroxylase
LIVSLSITTGNMIPRLASLRSQCDSSLEEWWWCLDESLECIGDTLLSERFVVVDDFLPIEDSKGIQREVITAYKRGLLNGNGIVGGGKEGNVLEGVVDLNIRGDVLAYFDGEEEIWPGRDLKRGLSKMNTIVCELKDLKRHPIRSALENIATRSKAMLTCYPSNGKFYSKHVDNPNGNGRRLTAIYYVNESDWNAKDGGSLVIHGGTRGCEKVEIAPLLNRLVLFWSDSRCPHEVLPCYRDRFAITLWFIDSVEKALVHQEKVLHSLSTIIPRRSHHVSLVTTDDKVEIEITFDFPLTLQDINISVSKTLLAITVASTLDPPTEKIEDRIILPYEIERKTAKAKFKSKESRLVVTLMRYYRL